MIHMLLTPPGEDTTQDNLGVAHFHNGCSDLALALATEMASDGWTVSMVPSPEFEFPDDHPARVCARRYIEEYLEVGR